MRYLLTFIYQLINLTKSIEKIPHLKFLHQSREELTCKQCYLPCIAHRGADSQKPHNPQDGLVAIIEVLFKHFSLSTLREIP